MRLPRFLRFEILGLGLLTLGGCVNHEAGAFLGKNPQLVFSQDFLVDQTTMQFDESKPGVDWGMSLAWQGDHYVVTADQNTTPNQPTQTWQIVAVQDIPLLKQGQMFAFGSCRLPRGRISRVVAIVDYDPHEQWFTHVEGAWAYDYPENKFADFPTRNLQCFNPRYGLGLDTPPAAATAVAPSAVSRH